MKKISLKCEGCGGTLVVDENKTILACPFCGHKSLIIENDEVIIERIKTTAQKEIELEKIKSSENIQKYKIENEQSKEMDVKAEKFKKSFTAIFLIVAIFISAIFTCFYFSTKVIGSGILSSIQVLCFTLAWCMGMGIVKGIKGRKRYIYILFALAGIVLSIPTISLYDDVGNMEEISWDIIFLGEKIPEPTSKLIEIHSNDEDDLWIDIYKTSQSEYYEYIIECKELGYTIGKTESSMGYNAYNEEGYHLDLWYSESEKEMDLHLEAPTETYEFNWDEHNVSSILPAPKSTIGVFKSENEEINEIIISNNTKDDYLDYVDKCKECGFVVDAQSEESAYTAYDENGNKVSISYNVGNKEMAINFEYAMVCKEIIWPTVGVGTLAPIPESLSGKVENDFGWTYSVYIEKTTREEYEEYVGKCIEAGFNKNSSKYEDGYWADYSKDEEISINVSYEGFDIMHVSVSGSISEDYSKLKRK